MNGENQYCRDDRFANGFTIMDYGTLWINVWGRERFFSRTTDLSGAEWTGNQVDEMLSYEFWRNDSYSAQMLPQGINILALIRSDKYFLVFD